MNNATMPSDKPSRKTKIIATIGPVTSSKEQLEKLAAAGMSVVRINMSHATHKSAKEIIDNVRKINEEKDSNIAILLDTQGSEIRTSKITEDVNLKEGDKLRISVGSAKEIGGEGVIQTSVNYENLIHDVKVGDFILIDDGLIRAEITDISNNQITCRVENAGVLGSRKAINLPGVHINTPTLTKKDLVDVDFGIKHDVDFIAMSFVRSKDDVVQLRKHLKERKAHARIISKIEDIEGIKNINEIIEASSGIMIARGDLGVEIPLEDVPIVQRSITKKCIKHAKPVIVATHLLESMVHHPRPTRAEVTDVANAVFEGADCLMLSAETTKGKYPIASVETMVRIALRVERETVPNLETNGKVKSVKHEITRDACISAESLCAKAILVFTNTGKLSRLVSKNRPTAPIYSFVPDEGVRRKSAVIWGVTPFVSNYENTIEEMTEDAMKLLKEKGLLRRGDLIVAVSDISPVKEDVDVMEVRRVT
ncbi:MAG: pyruvate kinase [archaeon]